MTTRSMASAARIAELEAANATLRLQLDRSEGSQRIMRVNERHIFEQRGALERRNTELEARVASLAAGCEEFQTANRTLDAELTRSEARVTAYARAVDETMQRCAQLATALQSIRLQEQNDGGSLVAARRRIDQLAHEVLARDATVYALERERGLRSSQLLDMEVQLAVSQQRVVELERTLVEVRDQATTLDAELVELSRVLEARSR